MLSLSKKTDYALLALSYLTRIGAGRAANTKEIAEQYDIPVEMLAKILQRLAKSQLVSSTAGATGGYRLARPATQVSIAEIIEAIDGKPAIAQCMKIVGNRCDQLEKCTIRKPLTRINARILEILSLISLDEINRDDSSDIAFPILRKSGLQRGLASEIQSTNNNSI